MDSKKQTNRLINAIGTTAETSLLFYRAAKGAGATDGEAPRLTQAISRPWRSGRGRRRTRTVASRRGRRRESTHYLAAVGITIGLRCKAV